MANNMWFLLFLSLILIVDVEGGYDSSLFVYYHNLYRSKETQAVDMKKMVSTRIYLI